MNLKQIKEIISLMNENNLSEIDVETEGMRIRLKKPTAGSSPLVEISGKDEVVQSNKGPQPADLQPADDSRQTTGLVTVKSPMVGTFFKAPAPDVPDFIKVGQDIESGQVVCIIEAMKLMNEIKSEIKGVVKQILVENGEAVEFGQALFTIQT